MSGQEAVGDDGRRAVARAAADPRRKARLRRPKRLSIRTRLTLTYSGLVTAAGAVLIALVYVYTRYVTLRIEISGPVGDVAVAPTVQTAEAKKVDTNLFELLGSIMRSAVGVLALLVVLSGTVGWVQIGRAHV